MYYGELERVKRLEKAMERLAYLSVGIDVLIAIATYMAVSGQGLSAALLRIGGYLMVAEVSLAALIFVAMVVSKHYRAAFDRLLLAVFRGKYGRVTDDNWYYTLAARMISKLLDLVYAVFA